MCDIQYHVWDLIIPGRYYQLMALDDRHIVKTTFNVLLWMFFISVQLGLRWTPLSVGEKIYCILLSVNEMINLYRALYRDKKGTLCQISWRIILVDVGSACWCTFLMDLRWIELNCILYAENPRWVFNVGKNMFNSLGPSDAYMPRWTNHRWFW